MGIMLLREFYANARMTRREKQSNPHYTTFVRGKEIDFSPASIKVIFKLLDIGDSEQSYEARRRSLVPSSNNSEATVERVVLVHSIIEGLDVKAELLITENISAAAESKDETKRLSFPSIIYRLLYANGIKKIDGDELIPIERPITAESMTKNKYLKMQQEIQKQIPQPPPQFQQEQVQHDQTLPQEFNWQELNQQFQAIQARIPRFKSPTTSVSSRTPEPASSNQQSSPITKKSQDKHYKEFLTHKRELQKQYQRDREAYTTITNHQIEFRKRIDLKIDYLCWGLQQTNPHLAPIPSQDIPTFCLNNMEKGKGRFEGALRPMPVGRSSSKGKGVEDDDHGKKKAWEARDDGDYDED
ncbi:hypothetical protein PIB30_081753 [Stylosanthes scabra]|uniref:Putative plant transposon protein domain-containing protein n=1 Tax=Stylosanthes scabra TaxID=79078 RepID=A0ABU6QS15_9FABA|nr:hypothetical protein [Stylosanthes scabra]